MRRRAAPVESYEERLHTPTEGGTGKRDDGAIERDTRSHSIQPQTSSERNTAMNKDQVKGRVEQAKGAVKETTGKAVGDRNLQAEGKVDKA